jgi:uncharacterized glyoxalase superfamily protein PhnB
MDTPDPILTPRLVVPSADDAIRFYQAAFGAQLIERYAMPDGHVVHAALSIRGAVFSLAQAKAEWGLDDPKTRGGSPVLLTLNTPDPDATCARAVEEGARVVIPIADRFYGYREGRIADPFGHLWILSKQTENLSPAEIEARMRQA